MNKRLVYIIPVLIVIIIFLIWNFYKPSRPLTWRVELDKHATSPYGLSAFFEMLPKYLDDPEVLVVNNSPILWSDTLKPKGPQLYVIITTDFNPSLQELNKILKFASEGNTVLVSGGKMSRKLDLMRIYFNEELPFKMVTVSEMEGGMVKLSRKYFEKTDFINPGNSGTGYFEVNNNRALPMGFNKNGQINFLLFNVKKGRVLFHSDPFLFCNYFLLFKENNLYLNEISSLIPFNTATIIWDEYFNKVVDAKKTPLKTKSAFETLWDIPSFKYAFLLLLAIALLFIILHSKRKYRIVPVDKSSHNETVEFVNTIGRLYFQQHDHKNLAMKMLLYFKEFVRTNYQINLGNNNNKSHVLMLSSKSNYPVKKIEKIFKLMDKAHVENQINDKELAEIYFEFQKFYNQKP